MQPSPFAPGSSIVAYLRDSGGDEQDLSIAQQTDVIRKWCVENGLTLTRQFTDEAISGSSSNKRTAFNDMIAYFRGAPIEAGVIIWKFSRFARNLEDAQFYKAALRREGYIVHSLNDNTDQSLDGRFFESAIDWMNARYLEDLSTDVKRGQRHMLQQYGAIGGTPPRGFKRESIVIGTRRDGKPHQVSRWIPDEAVIPLIKLAFKLRAEGVGYRAINEATHLYKSNNCYKTFFPNRLYIGELVVGDTTLPDYCEPVIDRGTWEKVQARQEHTRRGYLMGEDNKFHSRRNGENYILSGILYCAQCGALMNGKTITFDKTDAYYRCSRANRHAGCNARSIPARWLETEAIRRICEEINTPDNMMKYYNAIAERYDSERESITMQLTNNEKEKAALQKKADRLANAISESGHTKTMVTLMNDLEDRINVLNGKIINYRAILANKPNTYSILELEKRVKTIGDKLNGGTNQEKAEAIRSLTDRIEAARDGYNVRMHIDVYFTNDDADKKKPCL